MLVINGVLVTLSCRQFLGIGDGISILVTSFEFGPTLLVPDANDKIKRMLVTKTAKTVTNISRLSPTHFVSNIDVAQFFNVEKFLFAIENVR